jgi:PAS domain S-box-containing protein
VCRQLVAVRISNSVEAQVSTATSPGTEQQNQTVRQVPHRYYRLFDQAHDAVFILSLDGQHLEANRRATEMLGYSLAEIQQVTVRQLSYEPEASESIRQRLLAGEHIPRYERLLRKKDGTPVPVEIAVELVYDSNGQPLYSQSVVRDISLQKEREKELQAQTAALAAAHAQLELLVDAVRVAWWEVDVATGNVRLDRRKLDMIGHDPQQYAGASYHALLDLVHPEDYPSLKQAITALIDGRRQSYAADFRLRTANGNWLWLHNRSHLAQGETGERIIRCFVIDITERKEAEQQAIELALEKERIRLLVQFVQDTSHEFRTPLTIINSNAYLLPRLTDPDKRAAKAEQIRQQVERIARLLDMLLIMTKLENGLALNLAPVDVGPVLAAVCHQAKTAYGDQLEFRYEAQPNLPQIMANADYLEIGLQQIMDNACRFTPSGGQIVATAGQAEDHVWLEIQDSGPGIPEDILPYIFNTFRRQDEAYSSPGFGLGLSITRRIIDGHGGTITVKSTPGVGSSFKISLPQPSSLQLENSAAASTGDQ